MPRIRKANNQGTNEITVSKWLEPYGFRAGEEAEFVDAEFGLVKLRLKPRAAVESDEHIVVGGDSDGSRHD